MFTVRPQRSMEPFFKKIYSYNFIKKETLAQVFHVNFAKFLGKNFLKKPLRLLVLKILVLKTLTNCFCNNKPLNIVNYCYKALPHELLSLIFHRKNFISKKPVINQAISLTILLNSVQEFIEIEAWLLLTFFLCLHIQFLYISLSHIKEY